MKNGTFNYSYSAEKNKEVEKIRSKYTPREETDYEKLKKLDRRAEIAGIMESLCLGIAGSLVFGVGMCFFLDVFAGGALITALLMIAGTFMMIPAYPMCKRISKKTREELTPEILALSEKIMSHESETKSEQ